MSIGNAVIAASILQDLSVSLFNETSNKEVKIPAQKRRGPGKVCCSLRKLFRPEAKNIKNAVKSRVEKVERGLCFCQRADSSRLERLPT